MAQAQDVPAQELDWLVCNSGADIWHATAAGDAGGVAWSADERWEDHIDFRRADWGLVWLRTSDSPHGEIVKHMLG